MSDIFLYSPEYGAHDIIVANALAPHPSKGGRARPRAILDRFGAMGDDDWKKRTHLMGGEVVAQTLYDNLTERYGDVTGRFIYMQMEMEQKGPFKPGGKYDVRKRKRK